MLTMRVAMFSYHTCPLATLGGKETGGMNVYVRELTRALGRRGVGVDVFTRSQDEHVPHVLHDLGFGNRVVHIPSGPEHPLPKDELQAHLPEFVERVQDFAQRKRLKYDLIHSHYWLSGAAALQLQPAWKTPIVQTFHTLGEMKNQVARSAQELASPARLEMESRLLKSVDRIIASTQAELTQFRWLYQAPTARVVVVEPGVDTSHFYPIPRDEAREFVGVSDDRRIVLFVGRIEPLKGVDSLLRAVALIQADGKVDLHLMVIGGEPEAGEQELDAEMRRLLKLTKELGIEEAVTYLGRRDQDKLQYYYSAAEVVVMPSHYESFGLVALEAMACGTPVIASETGGLVFLVQDGETGFHVPTAMPAALAERLVQLLNDRELRARLGAQAAEYARGFDWQGVADRMITIYRQLVSEPEAAARAEAPAEPRG